jgi:hypothetical protein
MKSQPKFDDFGECEKCKIEKPINRHHREFEEFMAERLRQ